MEKTSVYLSREDRRRLKHLAEVTGLSQAQVVREAIASYDPGAGTSRALALAGAVDGPAESVAALTEEELLDGFGAG